ncbi:MAG: YlbF family regulator [Anaerolineales bacterium]|nr:YlbF family regulator [Anaerolineales bacterium]
MIYELNEKQFTPHSVVVQSARNFASAIAKTEQYGTFLKAAEELRDDQGAQQAIAAFQHKQKSLQMVPMENTISPEDQFELERLHKAFMEKQSVKAYFEAQDDLMAICTQAAQHLSSKIGINYPSACAGGCCG